jgi:hypothetical protein
MATLAAVVERYYLRTATPRAVAASVELRRLLEDKRRGGAGS